MEQDIGPSVKLLPWDSQFFNFGVARLVTPHLTPQLWKQVRSWCMENHIRCLYYEANLNDFESLSTAAAVGFLPIDVRVIFDYHMTDEVALKTSLYSPRRTKCNISPVDPRQFLAIEEIARDIGKVSRFHLDMHFPRGASGEMYVLWARKVYQSVSGAVLVATLNEVVAGFIACEREQGEGKIALVGVDSHSRGHGVGTHLVLGALDWFQKQGCELVQVVTQGCNVAAQRLYQKVGFRTASTTLTYHYWFDYV